MTALQTADFELGFLIDSKAVSEEDDGTLYIEGYASNFDEDRQDEAFEPGAFEDGLKSYMSTNPVMLYHHKTDTALGDFSTAEIHPGKGLWVKGRVPKPADGSVQSTYYKQIKDGVLKGFSVGGKFYRRMTPAGPRIYKCDLREISVTPLPVNPTTMFELAGKAFEGQTMETEATTKDTVEVPKAEYAQLIELAGKAVQYENARLDAIESELDVEAYWREHNLGKAMPDELVVEFDDEPSDEKAAKTKRTAAARTTETSADAPLHPDRHSVANLLMHQNKVANLAHEVLGSSDDKGVKQAVAPIAKTARKHTAALHHLAASIGPLPDYYSTY